MSWIFFYRKWTGSASARKFLTEICLNNNISDSWERTKSISPKSDSWRKNKEGEGLIIQFLCLFFTIFKNHLFQSKYVSKKSK